MVLQTHDFCIVNNAYRGVEQLAARGVHSPKVGGSSPSPATNLVLRQQAAEGIAREKGDPEAKF